MTFTDWKIRYSNPGAIQNVVTEAELTGRYSLSDCPSCQHVGSLSTTFIRHTFCFAADRGRISSHAHCIGLAVCGTESIIKPACPRQPMARNVRCEYKTAFIACDASAMVLFFSLARPFTQNCKTQPQAEDPATGSYYLFCSKSCAAANTLPSPPTSPGSADGLNTSTVQDTCDVSTRILAPVG